jgi:Spx/MgsR family transcriptional regulator
MMSNKSCANIFGIANCSTVKKALIWCRENNIAYDFHDYKKSGVPLDRLEEWCKTLGWKALINTKGPTWRKLTHEQQDITTQSKAVATMVEFSSLIRRPIVETVDCQILVGFDEKLYKSVLAT